MKFGLFCGVLQTEQLVEELHVVEVAVAEGLVAMQQAGQAGIHGQQKLTQVNRVALAVIDRFKQFRLRREFLEPEPVS